MCTVGNHHEAICSAEKPPVGNEPTGIMRKIGSVAAVAYQTLIVRVMGKTGTKVLRCRALLDTGSARSFITQKLGDELGSSPDAPSTKQTFEGLNKQTQELQTECHQLRISSLDGNLSMELDVKTLPAVTSGKSSSIGTEENIQASEEGVLH